jgi:hypothetical protein
MKIAKIRGLGKRPARFATWSNCTKNISGNSTLSTTYLFAAV